MSLRRPLPTFHSLLRLFVVLLLAASLRAENWQAFTTRLPAARVGHGFELRLDNVPVPGAVGSLGLQCFWAVLDAQSWGPPTAQLVIAIDQDATSGAWSLVDTTTGDVAVLSLVYYQPDTSTGANPVGGFGVRNWVDEGDFIAPAGVPPRRYFLLPEDRASHPFSLCQPGGVAYPVSVRSDAPLTYLDTPSAPNLISHTAYEASATFDPAQTFWIVDMVTYERTPNGATDLTSATWTYDPASIPMAGVTVLVEGGEVGHRFKAHSRAVDGTVSQAAAVAGLASDAGLNSYTYDHSWNVVELPTGIAALTFSVGLGMEFWITRDADGVSSAIWRAETASGGPLLWSALGTFPDPPQRATPLEARTFRIHTGRWGHDFTVWMADGYHSRFSVAPLGAETASPYAMAAPISSWDDQGLFNPLPVFAFTALIDPARTWWLRDDSTGESFLVRQTDVLDGWLPLHTAPPPDAGITLQLPAWRVGSMLELVDEQFGGVGSSDPSTYRSLGTDTFQGADGMEDFTLQSFTLSLTHPQAYSTSALKLRDTGFDPSNPDLIPVSRGANDLRFWFRPAQSLALAISSSRWDHDLILHQPNGDAYPIQKYSTQGGVWFDPSGNAWQTSYYYFDASADHHPELPWYVEDTATHERIGPWPTSEALINWIAVPTPLGLTLSLVNTGTIELAWPLAPNSSEGAFRIERSVGGPSTWRALDTLAANTADENGLLHFTDADPLGSFHYYYRVRYVFGGRFSGPSNVVQVDAEDMDLNGLKDAWEIANFGGIGVVPGEDADSDGLTNAQEFAAGTDPNDTDTDGDASPDAWEIRWGLNPLDDEDGDMDLDGDDRMNNQEASVGTNPWDAFNGKPPVLKIIDGNNQRGWSGKYNSFPLIVIVFNSDGIGIANYPATFTTTTGALDANKNPNATAKTLTVQTNEDGWAHACFKQPATLFTPAQITATVNGHSITLHTKALGDGEGVEEPGNLRGVEAEAAGHSGPVYFLSWDDLSDNEVEFVIERSIGDVERWEVVGTVGAGVTEWADYEEIDDPHVSYQVTSTK